MTFKDQQQPVIFFDGVCNLCAAAVQFIIRKDKKQLFLFASLQSAAGQLATKETGGALPASPWSVILYYQGHYYLQAEAVIKTGQLLGGVWATVSLFKIIPPGIRNSIYKYIARHRYKWFGKRTECLLPTPENKARFIE